MSDQAADFEKSLSSKCSFEPRRFFRGSIVLVENGRSDCLVASIYRHESFAVRIQAQRSDGIRKILRYRLRTMAHRLPKALGIYLRVRRSGEAQVCTRRRAGLSISPVSANTTALHLLEPISMASKLMMVFDCHLLYREGVSSNCWDTSRSAQGKTSLHRNLSAATESFRPRAPDSTTSIFLLAMETLATPRNVSGTLNNKIRNRT